MALKEGGLRFAVETSFLLLIFSLGFMQPNYDFGGMSLPIADLLFLVTGTLYIFGIVFSQFKFRFDKFFVLFGLYAGGLLLSAVFSENPSFSFFRYVGQLYLISLGMLTFQLVSTGEILKKVVLVWLAASSICGIVGVSTVLSFYLGYSNVLTEFSLHNYGTLPAGNYPRIQSTFPYPSMLCNYLTVSMLMLLAAVGLRWVSSFLFTILAVIFSISAVFTVTPGLGGLFLGVSMWFWLSCAERGQPVLGKLSLSSGIIALVFFLFISAISILSPLPPGSPVTILGVGIDAAVRLLTWRDALQTFLEHPFFGKGLGLAVANVTFAAPSSGEIRLLADAHNTFLNVAAQAGIVGAIPLLLIGVATVRRSLPFDFTSDTDSTARVCLGIAFVSAFICQGLVGSFEDSRHLWVLIGLIVAVSNLRESRSSG